MENHPWPFGVELPDSMLSSGAAVIRVVKHLLGPWVGGGVSGDVCARKSEWPWEWDRDKLGRQGPPTGLKQ